MSQKSIETIKKNSAFKKIYKYRFFLGLSFVLAIAVFFRLYRIASVPPGLYADVAANGLDGLSILDGDFKLFYTRNGGREGLFFYIVALFQKIITTDYYVLYLVTASIGVATIITSYFVIENYKGKKIALLSSYLMAVSFYHIHYSRLGYRTILMPLFILLIFHSSRKLLNTQKLSWGVTTGFITGLGYYSYLSYRAFLIGVGLSFLYYIALNRRKLPKLIKPLGLSVVVFIITVAPFFYNSYKNTYSYSRTQDVLVTENILERAYTTAKVFGIEGDPEIQYNVDGMPVISLIFAVFLLIGSLYLLKKDYRRFETIFIFLSIGSQLGIVAITDRIPHMLRAVGICAFLFLLVAIGIAKVFEVLENSLKRNDFYKYLGYLGCIVMVLYFAYLPVEAYDGYFRKWAKQENLQRQEFFYDYVELGRYLKQQDKTSIENIVIVSNWYRDDGPRLDSYILQTTDYILESEREYQVEYLNSMTTDVLDSKTVIIRADDSRSIKRLEEIYDDVEAQEIIYSEEEENFGLFYVYKL